MYKYDITYQAHYLDILLDLTLLLYICWLISKSNIIVNIYYHHYGAYNYYDNLISSRYTIQTLDIIDIPMTMMTI